MLIGLSCAGVAGVVVLITSVWVAEGVVPTLNPENTGRLESLFKTVREAPVPWAIVTVAAIAVLFRRRRSSGCRAPQSPRGCRGPWSDWPSFLVTAEPRGLMVAQVGVVVCAVVTFADC